MFESIRYKTEVTLTYRDSLFRSEILFIFGQIFISPFFHLCAVLMVSRFVLSHNSWGNQLNSEAQKQRVVWAQPEPLTTTQLLSKEKLKTNTKSTINTTCSKLNNKSYTRLKQNTSPEQPNLHLLHLIIQKSNDILILQKYAPFYMRRQIL